MRPNVLLLAAALPLSLACRGKAPAPARAGGAPPAAAAAATPGLLTGKVLETMDAAGYTYVLLDTAGGRTWAAVERSQVGRGDRVTVVASVVMDGFESRTLGRRFDRIVFGSLEAPGAPGPPAMAAALGAPHASVASDPAEVGPIHVGKANPPHGRTVAEVFAQRASLDAKPVAVRGKVVKFLPGIMGRNWMHLQDGTASPARKDHDLTVTISQTVSVGDVVLVRGTVRKDLDFGAGYAYAVLVEEARLSR